MASQAFLKISSIANSDSLIKESLAFELLIDPENDKEKVIHYINGLKKQHSLPVKNILSRYIDFVEASPTATTDEKIDLYEEMINSFTPPTTIVILPFMKATLNLAKIYESKSNFKKAVELSKSIHVDTLVQEFSTPLEYDEFRIKLNTNIAKNSLKIDQIDDAEAYITRIGPILQDLSKYPQYKELTTDALKTSIRIMIQLGKWQEASSRLLALDNEVFDIAIVKYAILSPVNHMKTNLFTKIVKSSHVLPNAENTPLFVIFVKVLKRQLVYYDEYSNALEFLLKSQINDIGREILLPSEYVSESFARAMVESNLIAASEVYNNTTIDNFTSFLKLDTKFVEEVAGEMIREERLDASIDDISKLIEFGTSTSERSGGLKDWHEHIIESCSILDKIVDDITAGNPQLSESILTAE